MFLGLKEFPKARTDICLRHRAALAVITLIAEASSLNPLCFMNFMEKTESTARLKPGITGGTSQWRHIGDAWESRLGSG